MRDIGKNIRDLRTGRNMTQDALAEKLFVTRQTVSNYETGKSRPDIDMLMNIAQALETDINSILYEPEDKTAQRKRILIITAMAMVMAALGILLQILVDHAYILKGQTYQSGLYLFACFQLRPAYFFLLGFLFMGSVRSLQNAKPLLPRSRKWIRLSILAVVILLAVIMYPYLTLPVLQLLNIENYYLPLPWWEITQAVSNTGLSWIFLLLGLLLGLCAKSKNA